jgi:hypothetical protein
MSDRGTVRAEALRARLPDGWRVEDDGPGVRGRLGGHGAAVCTDPDGPRASFGIRPDGELWTATWKAPPKADEEPRAAPERVTGLRERCVEWVLEKAGGE